MADARCRCGALTLTLPGPSRLVVACHCIDCQRRTGAPFSVGAFYSAEVVGISGTAKEFTRAAASGGKVHGYFCPDCGSTVYWKAENLPAMIGVAVGALADPKHPPPVRSVFEQSKHDWVHIDGAVEHFPQSSVSKPLKRPHFVDELKTEAETAIAAMRDASRQARHVHARAELMRHMLLTANKVKQQPKPDAIAAVVTEWMNAWHLTRADWPDLAREMDAFTGAFYDYANDPADASDAALRTACTALDAALAKQGTSLSDQMAWRSQCAHGWWEMVSPAPRDLPGRRDRNQVPPFKPGAPFWDAGCADMCK